jgi:hypothetical protein
VSPGHCLRAAIGSENGSDEATAHPRSSHATLISTRHRWALKAASVDTTVATQSLREPKLLLLDLDYIRFRDPKLRWKGLNRAKSERLPPSPCCGSMRGGDPLKTVLKPSRKPPGKSVNLQDAQPHGLHPGAPGPHRQVLGAAFEPQMSIWDPVVLGGCLGCSIWSINSKRRPLRTMGVV